MTYMARANSLSRLQRERLRNEWRGKLRDYDFTHFITLASNHMDLSYDRMRSLLRQWDARVNREINGPKWTARQDQRLLWFAFPEKIEVNPHWHLVAEVDPIIETVSRDDRTRRLAEIGEQQWLHLVPRGSFDCEVIDSPKIISYATKVCGQDDLFEKFIVNREFMNIWVTARDLFATLQTLRNLLDRHVEYGLVPGRNAKLWLTSNQRISTQAITQTCRRTRKG